MVTEVTTPAEMGRCDTDFGKLSPAASGRAQLLIFGQKLAAVRPNSWPGRE
jgi:hypothetical protein